MTSLFRAAPAVHNRGPVWLLGFRYESPDDNGAFQTHIRSRLWFTYRKNFPAIPSTSITSDVGWGCMLRCGQMLLAQTLINHQLGRAWRAAGDPKTALVEQQILRNFLDSPAFPFSIHRIAELGQGHGKNIGEWFGPNTMAHVIKELLAKNEAIGINCYVAMNNTLYIDDAIRAAKASQPDGVDMTPVLILIPLKLGLSHVDSAHIPYINEHFSFPQSLGLIGGRPNSAYYFIGMHADRMLYLDPHHTQPTVEMVGKTVDTKTYHPDGARDMGMLDIDTSLCLAYFCNDVVEFNDLLERIRRMNEKAETHKVSALFTVEQTLPSELEESMISLNSQSSSTAKVPHALSDDPDGDADEWDMC